MKLGLGLKILTVDVFKTVLNCCTIFKALILYLIIHLTFYHEHHGQCVIKFGSIMVMLTNVYSKNFFKVVVYLSTLYDLHRQIAEEPAILVESSLKHVLHFLVKCTWK